MGTVYSRKGTKKLWIKYVPHGRVIRESTHTANMAEARRLLRSREGDLVRGVPITPDVGRITFDEAASDLLNDYAMNRKQTRADAERRIKKHLGPCFGNRLLIKITTADLRAYVAKRLKDSTPNQQRGPAKGGQAPAGVETGPPVSAGEINRELTVLKRMFSLASQSGKLVHKPQFPMLRENNVRAGFFERDQYLSMLAHLPEACAQW